MQNILENLKIRIATGYVAEYDNRWNTDNFIYIVNSIIPTARLYFLTAGEGFVRFKDREYHLVPGKLFLFPPFANVRVNCPEKMTKYWCHFNANILDLQLDLFSLYQPDSYEQEVKDMAFTEALFKRISDTCCIPHTQRSPLDNFESNSSLNLLIKPFIRKLTDLPVKSFPKTNMLTELIIYIENHLDQRLSLEMLAKRYNLNPTYLSNLFCKKIGLPLISYCNKRRIGAAINLMCNTEANISEIADRVGFPDSASFSKAFKKHTRYSPSEYRKFFIRYQQHLILAEKR